MNWNQTKMTAAVGGAILMTVAAATVAQQATSTAVNDGYFTPATDKLRQLPAGLNVVRPTHFPEAYGRIRHVYDGDSLARTVGRNVTFRELMAEAYDCTPGHVVLPAEAPAGGYDFLVTIAPHSRRFLRADIKQEMGYTASEETRNTGVLVLQVVDAGLPGLTNSPAGEDDDITFKDGQLHFQHQTLDVIFQGLEEGLKQPVLDETGLTNTYDFSVVWTPEIQQSMRDGSFSLEGVNKALAGLGLALKPETTNQDMVIVKSSAATP